MKFFNTLFILFLLFGFNLVSAEIIYSQTDGSNSTVMRDVTGWNDVGFGVANLSTGWTNATYNFTSSNWVTVWIYIHDVGSSATIRPRLYGSEGGIKCNPSDFDINDYLDGWTQLKFNCSLHAIPIVDETVVFYLTAQLGDTYYDVLSNANDEVYIQISDDSADDYDFWEQEDTTSLITWNEPENGTSTQSRTIDIDIDYFINSETYATTTWKYLDVSFVSLAYPDDDAEKLRDDLVFDSNGNMATTTTLNRDGYYLAMAYFTDGDNRVSKTSAIKFNSATTTITADIPLMNPVSVCDSLDGTFDKAICKSMMFLFYPNDSALDKFASVSDIFESKVPFGYYYLFKNKIDDIDLATTTAPAFTIDLGENENYSLSGAITLIDLDDIDFDFSIAFLWIIRMMWVVFGVYVIARVIQVSSKI